MTKLFSLFLLVAQSILAPILFGPPPAVGGSGFTVGPHCSQPGDGSSSTTACTISSTAGMDSCYVATSQYGGDAQTDVTVTDNKGNNSLYAQVSTGVSSAGGVSVAVFYAKALAVGATHVFTVTTTATTKENSIAVLCVSGSLTTGGADAVSAFNNTAAGGSTIQAGNVTNANTLQIDVAAVGTDTVTGSIDSGFTIDENQASNYGVNMGLALAHKLEPTAVTENPTWTMSFPVGRWNMWATNATFKSH